MRFVVLLIAIVSVSLNVSVAFDRYTAHGGPIKGLAYSSKLDLLVSTSFDYTAVVWDSTTMQELKQLIGHNAAVNTAAFSPDGYNLRIPISADAKQGNNWYEVH